MQNHCLPPASTGNGQLKYGLYKIDLCIIFTGLKMTLFLEQNEYLSVFGREAGIRVAINPADTVALPVDDGITIRPGTITSIGLRYVSVMMG